MGTSATCVQSPQDGDSMSVSARSRFPGSVLGVAVGEAVDGVPDVGVSVPVDDVGVGLDVASPPVRTETPAARNEPWPELRDRSDAVEAVGLGVAVGAGLALGVGDASGVGDALGVGVGALATAGALVLGEALAEGLALVEGLAAINAFPVLPTA